MKKIFCLFTAFICILTATSQTLFTAHAAQADDVLQAYVSENALTVVLNGSVDAETLTCTVSSKSASSASAGALSGDGALIKTTILLDISTSMPRDTRSGIIALISGLIDSKLATEAYRLVTFGDEITQLCDFTYDRYDLSSVVEKIEFASNKSRIYDAIYNTIPEILRENDLPTFYRTIVITDGVDDVESGITKEELFIKLQSTTYPVDVISVNKGEAAENKELAAITRMSRGRSFTLNAQTEVTTLVPTLGVGGFSYISAVIPYELLDGTVRQVDISSSVGSVSLDIKCPVFEAPAEETEVPEPTEEPATEPEPTATPAAEPTEAPTAVPAAAETAPPDETPRESGFGKLIAYFGGGAAILAGAATTLISRLRKKKDAEEAPVENKIDYLNNNENKTEFLEDTPAPAASAAGITLRVSDTRDATKTWTLTVDRDIIVGRADHCDVMVTDKSASREQCKITAKGNALTLVHLSSTNKTSLNGSPVSNSAPLASGDTIKFGREALHVDYIQISGASEPTDASDGGDNRTQSIF